jgi:hypothetical protein
VIARILWLKKMWRDDVSKTHVRVLSPPVIAPLLLEILASHQT